MNTCPTSTHQTPDSARARAGSATSARGRRAAAVGLIAGLLVALAAPAATSATVATGAAAGTSTGSAKAASLPAHVPDAILVGFAPRASASDRAALRAAVGATTHRRLSPLAPDAERWTLPSAAALAPALERLAHDPRVRYAERDWIVTRQADSNDTYYVSGDLWGMHGDAIGTKKNPYGTGADEAWALGYTGSRSVYVGIIDEGIQFTHPDLTANIWVNPYETAGNGRDDDGNGYIDDVRGWDFVNRDAGIYDAGYDAHGTHVSGTIGGLGANGQGVAGVNWAVTLISGKFLGGSGGSISDAVLAVDYMTDLKTRHGLNIVATSNSWGGGGFSQALLDAINRGGDAGILFVAAAGNSSSNNDTTANYPSNYECTRTAAGQARGWDCVVAVASITSTGALSSFSSYGATRVDIGAPGSNVVSSVPTNSYSFYNGTSMATPHVSGALALCESIDPTLTARDLKAAVLDSAAPTASLTGKALTGGRLDVGALVGRCLPATAPPTGTITSLAATASDVRSVTLAWTNGVSDETSVEVARAVVLGDGSCGAWTTAGWAGPDATGYIVTGLAAGTSYCFRARGTNRYAGLSTTAWSATAIGRTTDAPPGYTCSSSSIAWVDPAGGTALGLGDDTSSVRSLGFSISSFGTAYDQVTVASNGYLRLGSSVESAYLNTAIPDVAPPNAMLAPAWDDWNPGAGGSVIAQVLGTAGSRRFVATWSNVPPYGWSSGTASFQAILEEATGAVVFQYLDMVLGSNSYDAGANATAGVEDIGGEYGTQISLNARNLGSGTAYRCTPAGGGAGAPVLTTAALADVVAGDSYSVGLTAMGGAAPYRWTVAGGTLPPGLSLGSTTGILAGTPTTAGTYQFQVAVSGSDGASATNSLSLAVLPGLAIATSALSGAVGGATWSATLAASGGTAPYTWSIASGSLPSGLSLSTSGTISGKPTQSGRFTPTFRVVDGAGRIVSGAVPIDVAFGKSLPANGAKLAATTSITLSWVEQVDATAYRWCVSSTNKPCSSWTSAGTSLTASLTVAPGQTLYWQVQASASGTWVAANGGTAWKVSISR